MKKLWILLVALALMAAAPIFASDVTLSGELMGYGETDFDGPMSGAFPKVELNLAAMVDDYNTVKLELDSEGGDWDAHNVAVDDFRLITDWGAALGLPIGLKTTVGYFDTYFTGWYYYENSGWAWYYDWDNGIPEQGPDTNGAVQVDVAAGPVNIHWYNDGAGRDFMVGVDGGFAGLSFWLAYGSDWFAIADGELSVEAAYAIMDMANASLFFRYNLGSSALTYGLNLGADFSMFHIGAGLEGDDVDFVDNIVAEISVSPVEAATLALAAFMDVGGAEVFAGLDVSGIYKVGAAEFAVGYMYTPDAASHPPAYFKADQFAPNGLYLAAYVGY